jgi:nuclear pore complex protein Nup133
MGEVYRGLILAEEVDDLSALVELSLRELDDKKAKQLGEHTQIAGRQKNGSSADELEYIENQIARYFRKFGQEFAAEFHKGQLASHRLADLIDKDLGPKDERTKFLRSHSAYAKLSWINEALNEDDMAEAGKSLMVAACNQEPNIWCKKLELSLAKLALKSAGSAPLRSDTPNENLKGSSPEEMNKLLEQNRRELSILNIQQQLYQHIRPTILEALDQDVAPQEVMRVFGSGILTSRHSLAELLKNGFYDIISHRSLSPETLIDVLTLMDQETGISSQPVASLSSKDSKQNRIYGKEFYLALRVLELADLEDDEVEMYRRLIWKRCLLRDWENWGSLGNTNAKSDLDVTEGLMRTAAFETIKQGVREGLFYSLNDYPRISTNSCIQACSPLL